MNFARLLVAALIGCLTMAACSTTAIQAHSGDNSYKIVAYYIGMESTVRKFSPLDINAKLITHINYAFADIKDGQVALMNPHEEVEVQDNFGKLQQLKRANPHLKTLISVGGWTGSKEFSNVALTPATRTRFADSAVAFIRQYGFDGVDIDWEFPVSGGDVGNAKRPEDKQNFTLLLQALRTALDRASQIDHQHYLLTAAIGTSKDFIQNTEMEKVASILDWANIMTYDFSGHWNRYAGHNTPMYTDPAIQRAGVDGGSNVSHAVDLMLDAGVPPQKMTLGMAFYGYSWKQCGATNFGQHQDCNGKGRGTREAGALDLSDIQENLVNKNGFVRHWNDVAKVPYLFNSETGEFITYDDKQSLQYKIDFLKRKGLAGAMFWEVSGDRDFVMQKKLASQLPTN